VNQKQIVLQATLGFLTAVSFSGPIASHGLQLQPIRTIDTTTPIGHRPAKNPKLSTQLAGLARAVAQRTTPLAPGEQLTAPAGFSIASLPKSARDAISAGQMKVNDQAEVQVYISVSQLTEQKVQQLRSFGVVVQLLGSPQQKPGETGKLAGVSVVFSGAPTVQGLLPIAMIEEVVSLPFVRFVGLPSYGIPQTGSVNTQGDQILQAVQARNQFGIDGTGIRVGVISGGIAGIFATGCTTCGPTTAVPSPITLSDLPNATGTRNTGGILTSVSGGIIAQSFNSPPDLESGNAEGTAMLEIVHDLAPGAQLYFANGVTSLEFEQAVNFLAANADVVVDDVGFFVAPPGTNPAFASGLYDGTDSVSSNTAGALNNDANPIRSYFTSVGNSALNHYEGRYVDSGVDGASITGEAGHLHLFQAVPNVTTDNEGFGPAVADTAAVQPGGFIWVSLVWDDPFGASTNDYDLFLIPLTCNGFDPSNHLPLPPCSISGPPVVGASTDSQTGTQDPVEIAALVNNTSSIAAVGIVIQNVSNLAAARTFDIFINTHNNGQNHNFNTVSGSVPAESDAGGSPVSVVSLGAIDQARCLQPDNCTGSVEAFSSQGPTESTPQAASRMKPDVTATDGVCVTGAGGFGNGPAMNCPPMQPTNYIPQAFFGTSAASPHGGGIAALLLQSAPCLLSSSKVNTPTTARTNLRNFLTSTAVPLPGVSQAVPNNIEGFGLLDALAAVTATSPTANGGLNQTVNATRASGATVTLSGGGTDPDGCPLSFNWSGGCGVAMGANPSVTCPIGANTETLTASNGGAKTGLPTNSVQITVSDFTVASAQAIATISPGHSAPYTINMGSKFSAFTNPVSLTCSGLPSLSSCSFSPASVTPGSGTVTSTLTISTMAPSTAFRIILPPGPSTPFFALWLGFLFTLGAAAFFDRKRQTRLVSGIARVGLLIYLFHSIVGCSGGNGGGGGGGAVHNPGTPTGTYSVTVTGTSNQLQHSTTVTLTVQ
jgi:Subtilase family